MDMDNSSRKGIETILEAFWWFWYKNERMINVVGCPYCNGTDEDEMGIMLKSPRDFRLSDTLFRNIAFWVCTDCGQSVMSEETVKKLMGYLERPGHDREADFARL